MPRQRSAMIPIINGKADAKSTLIIEHPFHAEHKLVETAENHEKTPALYRFRVLIDADKTGTFAVVEEQTVAQGIALLNTAVIRQPAGAV